jgi:hypothetical protein
MNELEKLIAALPRPEPGERLDQRIDGLLAGQPALRRRIPLAWPAMAACIGVFGFFLGRQSVAVLTPQPATIAAPQVADRVTTIPLNKDQLAGLLLRPAPREGMFGRGPVMIEISKTP